MIDMADLKGAVPVAGRGQGQVQIAGLQRHGGAISLPFPDLFRPWLASDVRAKRRIRGRGKSTGFTGADERAIDGVDARLLERLIMLLDIQYLRHLGGVSRVVHPP